MAVDAFIKFEDGKVDRKSYELANHFDRLGDSFSDLGGAFIKLVDDVSSTDTNFLKAEFAAHIKHDVLTIGHDFFKIGEDFNKLAGPLDKFDDAVVKFTDQFIKLTPPSESENLPTFATDFVKFEGDVKMTGLDFLKAASDIKSDAPAETLSLDFNKISFDYKEQGIDLDKLSSDFKAFGDLNGISESKVGESFIKISIETATISSLEFNPNPDKPTNNLSTDFHNLSAALTGNGDNAPLTLEQAFVKYAGDFIKLATLADGAFTALGVDTIKLTNAIEDAGPVTTPTFKLG